MIEPGVAVILGNDVLIHPSATIGTMPFCYERGDGWIKRKHYPSHGVVIGDGVEIYAHCNVDRGTVRDTVIGAGTVMDRMVHVAHDCQIGERVIFTAGVILAGHVTIGDGCYLGIGALVTPRVTIGEGAHIGAGTLVRHDIPPGKWWWYQDADNPGKVVRGRAV